MRRAQSSIDFLLVFALFLLLFVILYQFVLQGYFAKSTEKQIQLSARIEAEKVAFAVESAALVGNGTNSSFYLPSTLSQGVSYNVTILPGVVVVRYSDRAYTFTLATQAVNRSFLNAGLHNVSTIQGVVYIV